MKKTAIQELMHFIENDKMQETYTKDQILFLLNFKLDQERTNIMVAYFDGKWRNNLWNDMEEYYNKNFEPCD